ncbi:hypothetical protein D3C72_1387030 [compost metagenome]
MAPQRNHAERQQEQRRTDHAAGGDQAAVQAAALGDPASRQEAGQAVAGGRHQASQRAEQQLGRERDRAGARQHRHAGHPQHYAQRLGARQPFGKGQRADQHAHQRRHGIEHRGIARRQPQRRHRVHGERNAGVDHAQCEQRRPFAAHVPAQPQQRQASGQRDGADEDAHEGGRHRPQHPRADADEQEAGAPDGGQGEQSGEIGGFHGGDGSGGSAGPIKGLARFDAGMGHGASRIRTCGPAGIPCRARGFCVALTDLQRG